MAVPLGKNRPRGFDLTDGRRMSKIGTGLLLPLIAILWGFVPDLTAGERRGATLSVQKKDGLRVKGELIAVKQSSLLLLDPASGADVSIEVADISAVRIVKRSKAWKGFGFGAIAGAALGAAFGLAYRERYFVWFHSAWETAFFYGALFAVPAALLGLLGGATMGTDIKIPFEGQNDQDVKAALGKLRPYARIVSFK